MENFLLFNSINFFALAVLAILLIDMSLYLSRNKDFHKSIWRDALLFALLAQTLDIACWFVNGRQGVFYTIMGYGLNVLLFSISALMVAKMAMYIQYSSDFKIESYKKLKTICYFTVAYVAILCTVSIWGHFIFSVDSNNLYHREDWYYLMMAGVFFPVGYIFVKLVLKYAKTFNRILKDNKMIIL
ncbi:MAG: hypothetical protein PHO33_04615, partial [Clostridia bacterium]|nr:hypothetical protein [Clostridia bacterium]